LTPRLYIHAALFDQSFNFLSFFCHNASLL
jgi:hypothetical protein